LHNFFADVWLSLGDTCHHWWPLYCNIPLCKNLLKYYISFIQLFYIHVFVIDQSPGFWTSHDR
jgi:hypothetical protein